MRLDLSDPMRRLVWAKRHLDDLKVVVDDAIETANQSGDLAFHLNFEHKLSCYVLIVDAVPDTPDDIGTRVGDVLHSLRSALDHLAWVLVGSGAKPNPRFPERVAFPICDSSTDFKGRRGAALVGVRGDQRKIIREAQPYHPSELGDTLRFVRDFNNWDKHRITHTDYLCPREFHMKVKAVNCKSGQPFLLLGQHPRLEVGYEVLFIPITDVRPNHSINVDGQLATDIGFDDGTSVLGRLNHAYARVGGLLREYERDWP